MEKEGIRVFIVDDEPDSQQVMENFLRRIPLIKQIEVSNNIKDALPGILANTPDLIFLDIEMPNGNGFTLIHELRELGVHLNYILISGHLHYAIEGIRANVLDFLLKPIDFDDLFKAVHKAEVAIRKYSDGQGYPYKKSTDLMHGNRLKFPTKNGFILINLDEVVFVEADCNYSNVTMNNGEKFVISANLGAIEKQINFTNFCRISRSHLVNLGYLYQIDRSECVCYLRFNNQSTQLPIPKSKIKELNEKFQ